ncbi:Transcriptional regulator WAR1 [Coniochaeta hoffmannii]|uniref:Transcriptional regulator WAR1 n=1 Tax=Coniochaeta hoffmannii TaxID=91930 RepID=A0AA38W1C4_9PEZI|nr:Transcriptional regulator WAR1 [Coniochaeta hoffmannii]
MSGIEVSAGGTPAPYGRACVNCARAKCRCIYRTADASCERCHRLKKHCEPSVTVRKRNARRQVGSRTAQLEEKLEDLVSLLRNHGTASKPAAATTTASVAATHERSPLDLWMSNTPDPSHGSPSETAAAGDSTPAAIFNSAFRPGLFNHQSTVAVPISSMIQYPWMPATQRQAEEQLALFRDRYLLCFPCIYLPPAMTSEQLREEKPFSWFTIMMMSCQTSSVQFGMGALWQKIVSQKIIIEHEKSIDLLQGMVIFLAWSHYHKKDRPYLAIFSQLALSLVYDLSLNKFPGSPSAFACFKETTFNHYLFPRPKTMEDRRTVLACWYITSQIAFTLKKMEGLRWTPHLSDCLNHLDENPECPGDRVLAGQVRSQLLIDQAGSDVQTATMPPYYHLSALTLPVETVKKQMPPELEANEVLRLQLLYSEIVVLEAGLGRTPYNPAKPDLRRYEILSRLANTVKRYFELYWPVAEAYYTAITFAIWCQVAHSLMTLYKLSTLDEPAWDRDALRRDLDLLEVCDLIIRGMDEAGARRRPEMSGMATVPPQCPADTDIFSACGRMIVSMRNAWAAELAAQQPDAADPAAADQGPADSGGFVENFNAGGLAVPVNFLDDAWLTDIFNVSWE